MWEMIKKTKQVITKIWFEMGISMGFGSRTVSHLAAWSYRDAKFEIQLRPARELKKREFLHKLKYFGN